MGLFRDRLLGDGDDRFEFKHSKRPSLSYLVHSQDQLTEDALREIDLQVAREDGVSENALLAEGRDPDSSSFEE